MDSGGNHDPAAIRSLAVTPADVVNAFVYTRENPGTAVLRVTPPFHGRMRARLHVYHVEDATVTGAVHVSPEQLLREEVVRAYPTFDPADAAAPETRRADRAAALDAWRERAESGLVDAVALDVEDGTHTVDVTSLG